MAGITVKRRSRRKSLTMKITSRLGFQQGFYHVVYGSVPKTLDAHQIDQFHSFRQFGGGILYHFVYRLNDALHLLYFFGNDGIG